MKHQILVLTDNLSQGGAQRIAVSIASHLQENEQLARFVGLSASAPAIVVDDLPFRPNFLFAGPISKVRYLLSFVKAHALLRSTRPRILFSTLIQSNLVAIVAGRLLGRNRPVIVVREANTLYTRAKALGGTAMGLYWAARLLYPRADAVIAPSQGVADDLIAHVGISPEKVHVIYSPTVSSDLLRQAAEPITHRFLTAPEGKLFLGVGRLNEAKGFDTLIAAFARVADKLPTARLIILGEGPSRISLEAQCDRLGIRDKVDLPGFVNNPFPYMKAADVFVLSSRWEGLPNVLIQALACGTTSVSTDCPSGPNEILEHGRHGYLVPVNDPEDLASKMLLALDQPFPKEQLRLRADDFSEQRGLDRYAKFLTGLVDDHSNVHS